MAITYTFKVTEIEVAPTSSGEYNVVTRVRYNYKGVDEDGVEAIFPGATPMPSPSGSFVPYESLTEDTVITWLDSVSDKPHMQYRITEMIDLKKNPKYVPKTVPWATGSVSGSI
jgi:hypothetical protein